MIFSAQELDLLNASVAVKPQPFHFENALSQMPSSKRIPAQDWEDMCNAYSADLIAEKGEGKIASVRTFDYQGRKYTVGATARGGSSEASCEALLLIPRSCYHDECFTEPGWLRTPAVREMGYLKMIVSSKGVQYVIASKTTFVCGLPTVKPLSLAQAMEINARKREQGGWRALIYKDSEVEWKMYGGHPVVVYTSNTDSGDQKAVLLWKHRSEYKEFNVPPSHFCRLEAAGSDESTAEEGLALDLLACGGSMSPSPQVQAALF